MVIFTPTRAGLSMTRCYPIIQKWDDVARKFSDMNNMEKSEKEAKNKTKELTEKAPGRAKESGSDLQVHPAEHHFEQYHRRGPGPDCR